MVFIINLPREPAMTINHLPELRLVEFLVYIFSCFGTWFGLSILHLNPLKLVKTVKKRLGVKVARGAGGAGGVEARSLAARLRWCESRLSEFNANQNAIDGRLKNIESYDEFVGFRPSIPHAPIRR